MAEARYQDGDEDCPNVRTTVRGDSTVKDPSPLLKQPLREVTSARAHSQTDYTRERRRPEITILSAEPLTATSWFQGASGRVCTTTQSVWSENKLSPVQLPPSYEQVIKEKTKEQDTTPTPLPRRSITTTIATQTDTLEQNATNPDSKTPLLLIQQNRSEVSSKQPKKPPRPSLPSKCQAPQISPKQLCSEEENTISTQPCVNDENCSNTSTATDLTPIQHPVPRPRSKTKQSPASQVNVPPLILLQDSWEVNPVTPVESSNGHSGKYLKELLDVFSSEPQNNLSNSFNVQEKVTDQIAPSLSENMTALHSDRNIRAKIQAFESQSNVESDETAAPLPRARKATTKPPVLAPKPSISPRPSIKKPKEEELSLDNHINEDVKIPPTPAPRPQSFKKTPWESKDGSDFQSPFRTIPIPPSRPSLVRVKNVISPEEELVFKGPPSPLMPSKDLLNFNNHNSTALFSNVTSTDNIQTSDFVDAAINFEEVTGVPPPLPVQKAVGGPPIPAKPSLKDSFSLLSDVSFPPRPSGGKVLPPRPPPAKANPGRPPPPRIGGSLRRPNDNTVPQGLSIKLQQPQSQQPNRRASRKGPALPPRPKPGRSLYNKYTLEIPHGIAQFDHNGTNTGELSFQKNNPSQPFSGVLVNTGSLQVHALYDFTPEGPGEMALRAGDVVSNVEQLDSDWYTGTCRNMTGCFPIDYVKTLSKPVAHAPVSSNEWKPKPKPAVTSGPRCEARFDFEGEQGGELSFSEGDVIQLLEYVEDEWASGRLNGHVGIFPLNYVDVLEDLPPVPVQKSAPNKFALPGMAGLTNTQRSHTANEAEGVDWAKALYDFSAETEDDLAFQQGDQILVTAHIDDEWWSGRLNGREGIFPKAFVEAATGGWK
ncbi:SH3 domain-containing protein 19 ADAM-binding protein [Triplophysa tibetana]|uniref:SH3 domain-containing protein 19 ADAM-binding protein n=1 Tax=Triplophysa tibetana TaxID=1572043 RepID=A0A5A9PMG5_9TELE|nr:SH3 domain-containing protein 19 ADAM-binding protein [Triplophysa tibetana]